ncbi:MAG TPA: NifU family protein [Acidimicrobiales bacterium]|jgi:Fe-S cluster biogenesis protein NfuA|nr:NifU family protein [Acidimicrobiales bacterium]
MAPPQNLRATGDRIERLLDELHAAADPRSYGLAEELLRSVTDLYGGGLARVVELVGDAAPDVMGRLVDDELVASLLLVHGLHPDPVAQRVERALEGVRPLLAQHDGDVELLGVDIDAGAVLLRLLGSCDGCPSSPVTLQHAVEQAIVGAAPEITRIDVEEPRTPSSRVPVALTTKPVYESCPSGVLA